MNPQRREALRAFLATVARDPSFAPATGPCVLRLAAGGELRCLATAELRPGGQLSVFTADGRVLQLLPRELAPQPAPEPRSRGRP